MAARQEPRPPGIASPSQIPPRPAACRTYGSWKRPANSISWKSRLKTGSQKFVHMYRQTTLCLVWIFMAGMASKTLAGEDAEHSELARLAAALKPGSGPN